MKKFFFILLLLPVSLFAQKYEKKAEKELNKYIEDYVESNGKNWEDIQNYFENYLKVNKFKYGGESIEQGYIYYLKRRKKQVILPPLLNRSEFKALLKESKVLNDSNTLMAEPLIKYVNPILIKYNNKLSKESDFRGKPLSIFVLL